MCRMFGSGCWGDLQTTAELAGQARQTTIRRPEGEPVEPLIFTNSVCAPDNGRAIERGSRGFPDRMGRIKRKVWEEPATAKNFAG